MRADRYTENPNDTGSAGWGVLGFFFPLVGFILFLVWLNERPRSANSAGIGALISVLGSVLVTALIVILTFSFAHTAAQDTSHSEQKTAYTVSSTAAAVKASQESTQKAPASTTVDSAAKSYPYAVAFAKLSASYTFFAQADTYNVTLTDLDASGYTAEATAFLHFARGDYHVTIENLATKTITVRSDNGENKTVKVNSKLMFSPAADTTFGSFTAYAYNGYDGQPSLAVKQGGTYLNMRPADVTETGAKAANSVDTTKLTDEQVVHWVKVIFAQTHPAIDPATCSYQTKVEGDQLEYINVQSGDTVLRYRIDQNGYLELEQDGGWTVVSTSYQ